MADEANAPVAADGTKQIEEPTRPADNPIEAAATEAKPAEGGDVASSADTAQDAKPVATTEDIATKEETATEAQADTTTTGDDADAAPNAEVPATNGTPVASAKANNGKRKSGAGIQEHKKKTPKKGKKAVPEPRLNVQPGEYYMVTMRGYQPWPVIICDEEMLPESLLSKRPVSAKRIDGTYREDFQEGGKNAKDRRYPIMFLGSNEFAWQVNTELLTFDIDEVKRVVENGSVKKNKSLVEAYETATEQHDLSYFKQLLANHEQAMQEDQQIKEVKAAQKKEKKEKAARRKSSAAEESEDVEMEDAGDGAAPLAKKAKGSKKRKKEDDSDGENEKPAKTPKTKLKLTNKPKQDASAKKEPKPKKGKAKEESEEAVAQPEEPPMTEEERLAKREKSVLYLRHRLQKGFLSRDQAPKDEDMANMSDYLRQLEQHEDLEAEVIKKTKVHKVLKAIIKLNSIPKEEEFQFKKRSNELLTKWSGALAADTEPSREAAASASVEPTTNGVKHDEEKKTDTPAEKTEEKSAEQEDKLEEKAAEPVTTKPTDGDGDVSMAETKDEAPAVKADVPSAEEKTTEAAPETVTA